MKLPPVLARLKGFLESATPTPERRLVSRPKRRLELPFDEPIVRLILDDRILTRELCEIATWSPEAIGVVDFLSSDPFQQAGGQVGSWAVSATRDGKKDGPRTHPNVLAIGREMAARFDGKELVIGGDRFQSPYRNSLFFGDGYAEMEFTRDGTGEYCLSRLTDHPSLQIFGVLGNRGAYLLVDEPSVLMRENAIEIPWWKMLHISNQGRVGRYGVPLFQAQVDSAWRPLKQVSDDALDVIRSCGTAPWIHTFGAEAGEDEREVYRLRIEEERDSRILTDLFMGNGGAVERAAGGEKAIASMLEALQEYRTRMIPPGVPAYLFPGIKGGEAGKDLSGQPALSYARKIANARSLIGQQVRWAITLEVVLKLGYDFFVKDGQFEVEWPFWMISGLESPQMQGQQRLDNMMADLEGRYQHLLDLDNVGRVIEEVSKRHGA